MAKNSLRILKDVLLRYMMMAKATRRLPTPWNWAASQWLRSSSLLKERGPLRTGLGYVVQRIWVHVLSVTSKCFLWKIGVGVLSALLLRLKCSDQTPHSTSNWCAWLSPQEEASSEDNTQESLQTVCWRHVNKAHGLLESCPMVWWDEDKFVWFRWLQACVSATRWGIQR